MKKHFEAKKPIAVLFTSGMYGERKIIVPFQTEKKLIEAIKEPFFIIEKDSFFLGIRVVPSAIRGQPGVEKGYGGSYTNTAIIRTNTIGEVSIIHDTDKGYADFEAAYNEMIQNEEKMKKEEEEAEENNKK